MGALCPLFIMNEKNILADYNIEICIDDTIEHISLDVFTAMCDRFIYKKIVDFLTRRPISVYVHTFYNNKIEAFYQFTKKE